MTPIIATISATVPILAVLIYFSLEKRFAGNSRIIWFIYITGGLLSIIVGEVNNFFVNIFFGGQWENLANIPYLAFFEELFKFAVVYFFIRKSIEKYSLLNIFFFGISVALGFATLENIQYVFTFKDQWVYVSIIRVLLTVPMHAVTGGIIAMFLCAYLKGGKEIEYNIYGIGIGVLIHASFNFFVSFASLFYTFLGFFSVAIGIAAAIFSYKKLLLIIDETKPTMDTTPLETPEPTDVMESKEEKSEPFKIVTKEKDKKDFQIISRKKK